MPIDEQVSAGPGSREAGADFPVTVHKQVMTTRDIEVDEGVAELLELLWERGYETEFSCQGGEEYTHIANGHVTVINTTEAYLATHTFEDGVRFLREVYEAFPRGGEDLEYELNLQLQMRGPNCGDLPRGLLTWPHTHTVPILEGLRQLYGVG